MTLSNWWRWAIYSRPFLLFALLCNILGTIYGYIWYGSQLKTAPWYFQIFIPDSPTASLFLCIALIFLLLGKNNSIIEALAFMTLIKYGVWAVVMNLILFYQYDEISINGMMLLISHGIMALEAIIFYPRFKISLFGGIISILWIFHNDLIDYVFMQFPFYPFIDSHLELVAYIAFILSSVSILLYFYLGKWTQHILFDQSLRSQ
ncbi:DUF1405 domain-containing protein [Staphylococcus condimenti]|uniref:DUF1405 domain-containing protein n=1 Tax=Staphylococcus condimenti TaxID=70255 RepID=A0A143PAE4_9STAP|nr:MULTISPECIES: DUF1405 domain-containing protein [Staphylococcus]AMY04759.1 hypothetical protein A4G25_01995 [Staphylococcus condimenti]APR61000.1 hypothetical protein BTZ13_07250 [Staphylococcus condimenti]MDK8644028.1 DUF1405 domain-containing protein [Staphylococcus condimenti]OFP01348.1 hypothetical protein HMPREF3007_09515 [Staphylococcus sp. HMSC065E08]PNZ65444.1 DUF1405 domain-containing protein [Staphylococcus condimenti]